jgi:hypothetical protein
MAQCEAPTPTAECCQRKYSSNCWKLLHQGRRLISSLYPKRGSLNFKSANARRQRNFEHVVKRGFVGKSGYFFALKMGLCDEGPVKNALSKVVPLFLI